MEDRIQINGTWYVREQPDAELEAILHPFRKEVKPLKREDVTFFKGFVYETDKFCYEAIIPEYHVHIDIKFTDKRIKPWVEDHWDSMAWFKGVSENNPDSINSLINENEMEAEDILKFRSFLAFLKQQGWL